MYEFLDYCVEDVMTKSPVSVDLKTSIAEAEKLFEKHQFNALPVLDSRGALLGVVTKLDLLKAFRFTEEHMFPPYEEIMSRPIESVMTHGVEFAYPRTPLTKILEWMVETRDKSFPVVDGKARHVVGMVSREDVLAALHRSVAGERPRASSGGR